jgi:HD-GYP domain-containing protein (c-di-GMP phosphodiesterase class II)
MGFTSEHVELIRLAASLNDIGKVALPEELLAKPGPLTADERRALERHPQIGYRILDSLGADPVATWVLHHHERWDGSGYPGRLAGEHIPLGSRILFVADAYEAMTTDQAWRERLPSDAALAELRRCAGTQFDPRVVEAFVAELESSAVAA